jgi:hypothetical protein
MPAPRRSTPALHAAALLVIAGGSAAATGWPPPGRELPVELVGGRFEAVVRTVAGEPLRLFTDTGGGMVVRASVVERLGGAAGEGGFALPPLDPAGAIPPPPDPLFVAPDEEAPPFMADGMLGAPWFAGRAWTFDYPGERLLLHDEPVEVPAELRDHTVPLGFQRGEEGAPTTSFPRITAELAGEPLDLLFDTGATGLPPPAFGSDEPAVAVSFIVRSLADRWRAEHPEWRVVATDGEAAAEPGAELAGGYWIQVPEVAVAGYEAGPVWFVTRPDANFHQWMSQWMDRRIDGALGGNALSRFVVTVDYSRARATFAQPETAAGRRSLADLELGARLDRIGFAAYEAGHFAESSRLLARAAEFALDPTPSLYNAACAAALAGDPEAAFAHLGAARPGLRDAARLGSDPDLDSLHADPRWPAVLAAAEAKRQRHHDRSGDPDAARLVTEDLDRFWHAYDLAGPDADAAELSEAFERGYLEPGSRGLLQFYLSRIGSAANLASAVADRRAYYEAVRAQTLLAARQEPAIRRAFRRLEELYPEAVFPDVYFLVGRMSSGGTTSPDALLIGTELFALGADTPPEVVPEGARAMVKPAAQIPYIVSHELIHVQQGGGGGTLLAQVLREGGADFLACLIHPVDGWEPNYRSWGRAHERQVWERFVAEKDATDTGDWFYNYGRAADDWHPDLGYYAGWQIARGYFERAADERAAVRELILLADPQAIYEASGYAERFAEP